MVDRPVHARVERQHGLCGFIDRRDAASRHAVDRREGSVHIQRPAVGLEPEDLSAGDGRRPRVKRRVGRPDGREPGPRCAAHVRERARQVDRPLVGRERQLRVSREVQPPRLDAVGPHRGDVRPPLRAREAIAGDVRRSGLVERRVVGLPAGHRIRLARPRDRHAGRVEQRRADDEARAVQPRPAHQMPPVAREHRPAAAEAEPGRVVGGHRHSLGHVVATVGLDRRVQPLPVGRHPQSAEPPVRSDGHGPIGQRAGRGVERGPALARLAGDRARSREEQAPVAQRQRGRAPARGHLPTERERGVIDRGDRAVLILVEHAHVDRVRARDERRAHPVGRSEPAHRAGGCVQRHEAAVVPIDPELAGQIDRVVGGRDRPPVAPVAKPVAERPQRAGRGIDRRDHRPRLTADLREIADHEQRAPVRRDRHRVHPAVGRDREGRVVGAVRPQAVDGVVARPEPPAAGVGDHLDDLAGFADGLREGLQRAALRAAHHQAGHPPPHPPEVAGDQRPRTVGRHREDRSAVRVDRRLLGPRRDVGARSRRQCEGRESNQGQEGSLHRSRRITPATGLSRPRGNVPRHVIGTPASARPV